VLNYGRARATLERAPVWGLVIAFAAPRAERLPHADPGGSRRGQGQEPRLVSRAPSRVLPV